MRELKTRQELIAEGYQAEGALVFLDEFIEEEKKKQLDKLLSCPVEDMKTQRALYKYICGLKRILQNKLQTGIYNATEQFSQIKREELGKEEV
nr:MAG TPA: hypothetical protein [Caudoviricetes sp.]